jgi:hypothetical protein
VMNWRRLRSSMGSPHRCASLPQAEDVPEAPAGRWARPFDHAHCCACSGLNWHSSAVAILIKRPLSRGKPAVPLRCGEFSVDPKLTSRLWRRLGASIIQSGYKTTRLRFVKIDNSMGRRMRAVGNEGRLACGAEPMLDVRRQHESDAGCE